MKEEELIKQLENVEIPRVKLESHRIQLRTLLTSRSKKETFMQTIKVHTDGIFERIYAGLTAPRLVWKVAVSTIMAMLVLFAAFISIPQTSDVIKATLFPEGSRRIGGPQLTAADQDKARQILAADSRVQEILAQGAVIDKILPIEVTAEVLNPQTGNTEQLHETWAQAWLVKGSRDWGIQIDLVSGKVVSITP